jgi:hypothetical protein
MPLCAAASSNSARSSSLLTGRVLHLDALVEVQHAAPADGDPLEAGVTVEEPVVGDRDPRALLCNPFAIDEVPHPARR